MSDTALFTIMFIFAVGGLIGFSVNTFNYLQRRTYRARILHAMDMMLEAVIADMKTGESIRYDLHDIGNGKLPKVLESELEFTILNATRDCNVTFQYEATRVYEWCLGPADIVSHVQYFTGALNKRIREEKLNGKLS